MKSVITILFVSHTLCMDGGANRSMMQLIMELRRDYGVNPIVLLPKGKKRANDEGLDAECKKNGIQYIEAVIPWTRHSNPWLHRAKYIACIATYPFLVSRIKRMNISLVHSNGSVFELGGWISRSLGVPHIWHLREFGFESDTVKFVWGNRYYTRSFRRGDAFIAISDAIKRNFISFIPEEKLYRIYNGISAEKYNKQATHCNAVCQFAMMGVITPHKNQLEAVKAAVILKKRGISNFHISFMGSSNAAYVKEINSLINDNNLENNVSLLGFRNNVTDLLATMDVGLMLSRSEAFGRVTIEYMLQNLAVIASDTGANPELIQDGIAGLLYHFGDVEALADKMQQIIEHHDMMVDLAGNGHHYALNNFRSEKNTKAVYDLYKGLLEGGSLYNT